jgi:hypothetical protein
MIQRIKAITKARAGVSTLCITLAACERMRNFAVHFMVC